MDLKWQNCLKVGADKSVFRPGSYLLLFMVFLYPVGSKSTLFWPPTGEESWLDACKDHIRNTVKNLPVCLGPRRWCF